MKNLILYAKDKKYHALIRDYIQLLKGKERKKSILEVSETNLLLAVVISTKCTKDEDLETQLLDKVTNLATQAKTQKKVSVEAILSFVWLKKYSKAIDLFWIKDKDTEDFKNANLAELQSLENESVNADIMSFFIGISPDYETALQFFNSMPNLGIETDISCYTSLIGGSPDYPIALQWYNQLKDENLTPTEHVYGNLISKDPDYPIALQWYNQLKDENLTPTEHVYSNLISLSPDYPTALQWYNQLKGENLTPTKYIYNNLISKSPDYPTALQWYNRLKDENLMPTVNTYANMISNVQYLSTEKQNEVAKRYYSKIIQAKMDLGLETYKFMMDYSLTYTEAKGYFVVMEKTGLEADEVIWSILSKKAKQGWQKKEVQVMKKERGFSDLPNKQTNKIEEFIKNSLYTHAKKSNPLFEDILKNKKNKY